MPSERLTVFYSRDFKLHDSYPYTHPESPRRLDYALEGLHNFIKNLYEIEEPPAASIEVYELVHDREYLSRVRTLASTGRVEFLDPDTYISPGTIKALEKLSGAAQEAIKRISEEKGPVIILGRPPGHHTGRSGIGLSAPTQGFCIANTSALLAILANRYGKTLVIDIDAHHGNGTQDILWELPIPHIDLHQDYASIYPGTGAPEDVGGDEGYGTKVNINIPPRAGDDIYDDISNIILYSLEKWRPDYIIVSAGFDAYNGDTGFVNLRTTSNTFYKLGKLLRSYSKRLAIMLEGGYYAGLLKGLPAFLAGVLGFSDPVGDASVFSPESAWRLYEERKSRLLKVLGWNI